MNENIEIEKRNYPMPSKFEWRMDNGEDKTEVIEGYGIVFNKRYQIWGRYYEEIAPEAGEYFKDLKDDEKREIIASYNHNFEKLLGKVGAGTLDFKVDKTGVRYIIQMPKTSYAADLVESIKRGDVSGSSFVFTVEEETYVYEEESTLRKVLKFRRVYEVGPVVMPAYADTTVSVRSIEAATKKHFEDLGKIQKRKEQLAKAKEYIDKL
jgi:hypothetical protein